MVKYGRIRETIKLVLNILMKRVYKYMSSLFDNKLQKMAKQYSKTMAKATNQGEKFADSAFNSLTPETLKESFEIINSKGHDHEKNKVSSIQMNYNNGIKLDADQLIALNDIFVAVTKRVENNGEDYDD